MRLLPSDVQDYPYPITFVRVRQGGTVRVLRSGGGEETLTVPAGGTLHVPVVRIFRTGTSADGFTADLQSDGGAGTMDVLPYATSAADRLFAGEATQALTVGEDAGASCVGFYLDGGGDVTYRRRSGVEVSLQDVPDGFVVRGRIAAIVSATNDPVGVYPSETVVPVPMPRITLVSVVYVTEEGPGYVFTVDFDYTDSETYGVLIESNNGTDADDWGTVTNYPVGNPGSGHEQMAQGPIDGPPYFAGFRITASREGYTSQRDTMLFFVQDEPANFVNNQPKPFFQGDPLVPDIDYWGVYNGTSRPDWAYRLTLDATRTLTFATPDDATTVFALYEYVGDDVPPGDPVTMTTADTIEDLPAGHYILKFSPADNAGRRFHMTVT